MLSACIWQFADFAKVCGENRKFRVCVNVLNGKCFIQQGISQRSEFLHPASLFSIPLRASHPCNPTTPFHSTTHPAPSAAVFFLYLLVGNFQKTVWIFQSQPLSTHCSLYAGCAPAGPRGCRCRGAVSARELEGSDHHRSHPSRTRCRDCDPGDCYRLGSFQSLLH